MDIDDLKKGLEDIEESLSEKDSFISKLEADIEDLVDRLEEDEEILNDRRKLIERIGEL